MSTFAEKESMMWIAMAIVSSVCLGFYDIFKKVSLERNNVLVVLFLNTLFGTLLLSPVIVGDIMDGSIGFSSWHDHLLIMLKSVIVLSSWALGYVAIKHLPLTITGPITATRPVMVLVGALVVFGERLNGMQWAGIVLGFASLLFISQLGAREGFSMKSSRWLWYMIGATVLGAVSALYDKYLMQHYEPLPVQAWYTLYQCVMMGVITLVAVKRGAEMSDRFTWRWSIPLITLFITVADLAYFFALSLDGSMVSVVSMIRRGSVLVTFFYGVLILREKNIGLKLVDLAVLLAGLALLIAGSWR